MPAASRGNEIAVAAVAGVKSTGMMAMVVVAAVCVYVPGTWAASVFAFTFLVGMENNRVYTFHHFVIFFPTNNKISGYVIIPADEFETSSITTVLVDIRHAYETTDDFFQFYVVLYLILVVVIIVVFINVVVVFVVSALTPCSWVHTRYTVKVFTDLIWPVVRFVSLI